MGIPNAIDSLDKKYPTLIQKIKTQSIPAYKIELFLNSIEKNIDSIPLNKWNIVLQVCQTIQLSTQNSEQKQKSFDLIKKIELLKQQAFSLPLFFKSEPSEIIKPLKEISLAMALKSVYHKNQLNLLCQILDLGYFNLKQRNSLLYFNLHYALKKENIHWRKVKGEYGYTIFHYLSLFEDLPLIQSILSKKDQINDQDNVVGQTPLHLAGNQEDLIRLLINCGAQIDLKDKGGKTFLDYLLENEEHQLIQKLANRQINHSLAERIYFLLAEKAFSEKNHSLIDFIHEILKQNVQRTLIL